jgi:hypothetical protein
MQAENGLGNFLAAVRGAKSCWQKVLRALAGLTEKGVLPITAGNFYISSGKRSFSKSAHWPEVFRGSVPSGKGGGL